MYVIIHQYNKNYPQMINERNQLSIRFAVISGHNDLSTNNDKFKPMSPAGQISW